MSTLDPKASAAAWPEPSDLLPHGPSARFIERILEHGETHVVCRVVPGTTDADRVEGGAMPAAMGVEYMAQAIAVLAGLQTDPTRRRAIGYIIAVRNLELATPTLPVGVPLDVRATWQWGDERLGRFQASIEHDGRTLASAVMSVYRPEPEEQP